MSLLLKFLKISLIVTIFLGNVIGAQESHTVVLFNRCGRGTPILRSGDGQTLSTGRPFTSNGPLISAISFLQTGSCGFNGEGCTVVETTLMNGNGSSTYISLIPPRSFSVTTGFGYFTGCEDVGADCISASCADAFHHPNDPSARVGSCTVNDVNLVITFCH